MDIGNNLPSEKLQPQLIRPRDAARYLAISERKLWELMRLGRIPCIRIDRSVRYDLDDLREWIKSRKEKGNA